MDRNHVHMSASLSYLTLGPIQHRQYNHQLNFHLYKKKEKLRWPGIKPGSIAWKATMLTITPPTLAWLTDAANVWDSIH